MCVCVCVCVCVYFVTITNEKISVKGRKISIVDKYFFS